MLSLLAEIYEAFPEQGDSDAPRLVIFIDEAHLIFDEASDALLDQIETIVTGDSDDMAALQEEMVEEVSGMLPN